MHMPLADPDVDRIPGVSACGIRICEIRIYTGQGGGLKPP